MLILSRHKDEGVVLQDAFGTIGRVVVCAIHGDKARIGFDLPGIVVSRPDAIDQSSRSRVQPRGHLHVGAVRRLLSAIASGDKEKIRLASVEVEARFLIGPIPATAI